MTAPFPLLRREKKTEHTMSELAAGGAGSAPVEVGAFAVLCKNFLLQTLIYFPWRH